MVAMERGKYYVAGNLTGLNRPVRDFFCKTPAETREDLPKGVDVVAFQCRNPIHRAHYEVSCCEGTRSRGCATMGTSWSLLKCMGLFYI